MLLATVGVDSITGYTRFTFDKVYLLGGISFIPVMIGLFAVSQIFISAESVYKKQVVNQNVTRVLPTREDMKTMLKTAPICGAIGTMIGIIPGAGADIGAFVAYGQAKKFSRHPEKFGTGIAEAVAAAEAGNNGVTGGAMIPMLTMGIHYILRSVYLQPADDALRPDGNPDFHKNPESPQERASAGHRNPVRHRFLRHQ